MSGSTRAGPTKGSSQGPVGTAARLAALASVPDHQGDAPPTDAPAAVAPPPDEIGPLLSAERVTLAGTSTTVGGAIGMAIIAAVIIGILLFLSPEDDRGRFTRPPAVMVGTIAGGLAACGAVGYFALRRRPETTYVGRDGVAVYRGRRDGTVKRGQVLRFADVDQLFANVTREYRNGFYLRTSYTYSFKRGGRTVYKTAGMYRSLEGNPRVHDPFHFARAADIAWTEHLLARCRSQMEGDQFLDFHVNRTDTVRVGPGVIEFRLGRRSERIGRDEIASARLTDGTFHVVAKDARWFARAGKYQFDYAKMANARLFLIAWQDRMALPFDA